MLAFCLLATSCVTATTSTYKLNKYVDEIESNCGSYTEQDWEEAAQKAEELIEDIQANYDNMTPEEREAAMKAIGRYTGIATKQGIQEISKGIQKALEGIPALIEGFSSAFGGDGENREPNH